jgi:hypothetical protein
MHDPAQHIEVSDGRIVRYEMHAWFNDRRSSTLSVERSFDGIEDFRISERKPLDVRTVEIRKMDGLQFNQSP